MRAGRDGQGQSLKASFIAVNRGQGSPCEASLGIKLLTYKMAPESPGTYCWKRQREGKEEEIEMATWENNLPIILKG